MSEPRDYTEEFNALPKDVRHIAAMVEAEMRINQLKMEKERIKKGAARAIKEVDNHISNLWKWIASNGE